MSFSLDKWDKLSSEGIRVVRTLWGYSDAAETLATLATTAFLNDVASLLTIGDSVYMLGSDGVGQYEITAVTPNVTMAAATDPGALSETLADSLIFIGNSSNIATGVAMSGDITINNAGATVISSEVILNADVSPTADIEFSKLEALASSEILVGSAGNDATAVSMSGDIYINNTGLTTIQEGAVTSSKVDWQLIQKATVTMSAGELNNAYAAPHLLLAAEGADLLIVLESCQLVMTYGTTQFAAGGVAAIQYDSTINGAGIFASTTQAAANFQDAASTALNFNQGTVKNPLATCVNKGLYLSNVTGAFTTGDSTFVAHIWYRVVSTV